jgi:IS1 family transposase
VDRTTHTIVSWVVVPVRDLATLHTVVDDAPQATAYYSDGLPGYQALVYGLAATHTAVLDKSEPYSVEGGNADPRHDLARLVPPVPVFFTLSGGVAAGHEGMGMVR